MPKSSAVIQPNLGLYLDRAAIALDLRMLQDGLNFRVKEGKLTNLNLGYVRFSDFTLNGPNTLIENFFIRGGTEKLIFGTPTDLYRYIPVDGSVAYITPIYVVGTAAASGTAVTGTTTLWAANAKAGDQIHFGSSTETDPTATWFTIDSVTNDTAIVLTSTAGTVVDGPYTIRQRFTGDNDTEWSTDTFVNASPSNEDEWWATNGVDDVVRWNGTDAQVEVMSALNFTCKSLVVFSNMMIFMNLVQGGDALPTDMINSNPGEPQNVSSGLSEQFKVHSGVEEIQRGVKLGDLLAIYSKHPGPVTLVQFVGDPLVFVFRNVVLDKGIVGPRAVARFPNYHEYISADGQYLFDGASVKRQNMHVWRETLRQSDPVRLGEIYSHFDEENGDLVWSVPLTTDTTAGTAGNAPGKAIVQHYLEEMAQTGYSQTPTPHSRRTWLFTASGHYVQADGITWDQLTGEWQNYNFRWNDRFFSAGFPLNMGGTFDGKVYTVNTSQDADGAALPSFVKFGRRPVIDGMQRGLLKRIFPFVTTFTTPIDVTAHFADFAMGPATITETVSYDQTLPEGQYMAPIYRRGRYFEVEFGSDGPGQPWEVSGYDHKATQGGMR